MAFAGAIAGLGGSIISGMGASKEAQANADAARYRGYIAYINAQLAETNARMAIGEGEVKAWDVGFKGGAQAGALRATQGASGIDMGSASSQMVRTGQAELTRLAELRVGDESARQAYAYRVQAYGDTIQGNLDMAESQNFEASKSGLMLSSILGGASSFADKWSSMTG